MFDHYLPHEHNDTPVYFGGEFGVEAEKCALDSYELNRAGEWAWDAMTLDLARAVMVRDGRVYWAFVLRSSEAEVRAAFEAMATGGTVILPKFSRINFCLFASEKPYRIAHPEEVQP